MLKKIIRSTAVLIMAAALSQAAFTAGLARNVPIFQKAFSGLISDSEGGLRWTNITDTDKYLYFSNGKAVISFRIYGKTGTTYTNGQVKLVKINGSTETTVATWSGLSGTGPDYEFYNDHVSVTSGTYKATLVIYAARYGLYEKIELSKTATY